MAASAQEPFGGYLPRLIVRDGRYFFQVPELGLLASGDDVQGAYAALVTKEQALIEDARAADLLDELPPPGSSRPASGPVTAPRGDLRDFLARVAIVLVAAFVLLVPVAWMLGSEIGRATVQLRESMKIGHLIERELTRAARPDKALEPERRERMLSELRVLVSRAKPFVDEVRPLFADTACPAEPDAGKP